MYTEKLREYLVKNNLTKYLSLVEHKGVLLSDTVFFNKHGLSFPHFKPCNIYTDSSSAQPTESLRCHVCGHWTSDNCSTNGKLLIKYGTDLMSVNIYTEDFIIRWITR